MPASSQPNGQTQPEDIRVALSPGQASLFKQLLVASNEAQTQVQFAMVAAGINAQSVIGGDLDAEQPYFVVRNVNGAAAVD